MSESQCCPDAARLQALLDGTLPEDMHAALAAHLESCTTCQHQLELLAGGTVALPQGQSPPERRSPALEQAMHRLKSETPEATQTVAETHDGPLSFNFLKPPDNPRHLGRLGGYEILELIGRGGMGIVFKGRDRKLERLVAVKVLSPELASSAAARKRFLREAQAAAAVTHEHVVTIHAVDEADATPFLVMEYIVGVSLEDRIQRSGHLRVEEILRIGMQAAAGLAAAHAQGLVHRDIKPSNILLENGVERVKITDFGLARVIHEAQSTQSNVVAGTPQYMSPEQARGEPVDHRSDLFSLGCVLYAMCTGRSPFRAETPTGAIHRVCEDAPRPIREINPDIPHWLVAIIDRLVQKKPDHRFQSATEVAEVLGQYLAHVQQPSRVPLPSRPLVSQKDAGRRRWLAAALIGPVAVILLGLIGWWLLPRFHQLQTAKGPEDDSVSPGPEGKGPAPPPRFTPVSLEPYANRLLTESPEPNAPDDNLGELEPKVHDVDGIPIEVRSKYIQLGGHMVPGCPDGVKGIVVNDKAGKVHFLHGCTHTYPEHGATVATYTFHYEDGSQEVFPVISGRHLHHWHCGKDLPRPATRATLGWRGSNPAMTKKNYYVELFLCSWENPHPEKTISTIDFERGLRPFPAPFCVGITCDDDRTPLPDEKGLLDVRIGGWAGAERWSIVIPGHDIRPIVGKDSRHHVLLPAGNHRIEFRDENHIVRSGTVAITPGGRACVTADTRTQLFPLPGGQPQPTAELTGQTWAIWDVALSRDGTLMATAGGDGTVFLWTKEGTTWRKQATLDGTSYRIRSVAFSPDARVLATAAESGALRLWDIHTGQVIASLKDDVIGQDSVGVYSVDFSPDGDILASGNGDGTIDIWNWTKQAKLGTIQAHAKKIVHDIAFSPDGTLLASAGWRDNAVKVWELSSKQQKRVMHGHTDSVSGIAFSPDGRTLVSASADTSVRLWSVETGRLLDSFWTPCSLNAVAFSSDGLRLAVGGQFQTVHIYDLRTKRVAHEFHAHWDGVLCLAFARDGKMLVSGGADNSTRVWAVDDMPGPFEAEPTGPQPRASFAVQTDWSFWATFSPKGNLLAGVDGRAYCRVWNLKDYTCVATFEVDKNERGQPFGWMCQNSAIFTPDGESFVTCVSVYKEPPRIAIWDPVTFRHRANLEMNPKHAKPTMWDSTMVLDRGGNRLFVASPGQSLVCAIDLRTNATLWSTPSLHGTPRPTALSPDGRLLAVGTEVGRVVLLDAETGREIRKPLSHGTDWVTAVTFEPQGKVLASTGMDGTVKLWTMPSFDSETLPSVHEEKIMHAAFSPDGTLLVTTGTALVNAKTPWEHKGEVCLWDVATRKLLTKFHTHHGGVTSAVFSPDGKSLATTGRDGKMHLWDVPELLKWQDPKVAK